MAREGEAAGAAPWLPEGLRGLGGEAALRPDRVEPVFAGKTIRLELHDLTLPNGVKRRLEIVKHPGAAAIVPVDAGGRVILIRQLRYAASGGYLLEVPAGKLDPGEEPEACARRELEEETGLRAGRLEPLSFIWPTPGFCDERIHLFLATDLTKGEQRLEDDELIRMHRVEWADAMRMVATGAITDAKTIAALARAHFRLHSAASAGT